MASNPTADIDDDWGWADDASPAQTRSPATVPWGVSPSTTSPANQSGQQLWSPGSQTKEPERNSTPVYAGRGRGYLRNQNQNQNNFPGQSPLLQQPSPQVQPVSPQASQTHAPRGMRPIVGRSQDTNAASLFNFRTMAASLDNSNSSRATVEVVSDTPPASQITSPSLASGDNNEWNAEESPSKPNIDSQVTKLGMVLAQASIPSGKDAERKLEALRQDPNHPLYSMTSFEGMELNPDLKRGLNADRKYKLSAIQEKTLPALNSPPFRNCIAQSQNGTGKTVAFVVTMLNRVDLTKECAQALCLLPTKELAQQVVDTALTLGKFMNGLKIHAAVRDSRPELNSDGKVSAQIVIGTAGTINTLMRKTRQLEFNHMKLFVVDEADKMLERKSDNFHTTIDNIKNRLQPHTQRVFFSATFNDEVVEEAKKFMNNPIVIRVRDEELSLDNIRHFWMQVRDREEKLAAMKLIYNAMTVGQSIVFCKTRSTSHWLSQQLRQTLDFKVAELSGDMEPHERDEQIQRFRKSADRVLVTTNVSARGLDISSVNLIINWDPPIQHETGQADFDTYLHRVGRSGRFGADGIAVNMIERHDDRRVINQIQDHFGIRIEPLSNQYSEMEKVIGNQD